MNIEGIGETPVEVTRDGRFWWAEGVHYDYGAQGDDETEALDNFRRGLSATIKLNMERVGNIDRLIKSSI